MNTRPTKKTQGLQRAKTKGTSGYKKIQEYIKSLPKERAFQERIIEIRLKYGIPATGTPKADITYLTVHTSPSRTRRQKLAPIFHRNDMSWNNFVTEVREYCEEELSLYPNWHVPIQNYALFNELIWEDMATYPICVYGDMGKTTNKELLHQKDLSELNSFHQLQYRAKQYPLVLYISQYASERDIIDYVKKTYKAVLEPMQRTYQREGIALGKVRGQSTRTVERNAFIRKNKKISGKELARMVQEKFGGKTLDYTYINSLKKK